MFLLAYDHQKYWIRLEGTRKEWVAMGTNFFTAKGVLPVELLAYQVSMVPAANWPT